MSSGNLLHIDRDGIGFGNSVPCFRRCPSDVARRRSAEIGGLPPLLVACSIDRNIELEAWGGLEPFCSWRLPIPRCGQRWGYASMFPIYPLALVRNERWRWTILQANRFLCFWRLHRRNHQRGTRVSNTHSLRHCLLCLSLGCRKYHAECP